MRDQSKHFSPVEKPNTSGRLVILVIVAILLLGAAVLIWWPGNPSSSVSNISLTAPAPVASSTGSGLASNQLPTAAPVPVAGSTAAVPAFDLAKRLSEPPLTSEADFLAWAATNSPEETAYLKQKWNREQAIVANGDATSTRVLQAFLRAPREYFFNAGSAATAYASAAIPIGYGQTISGPHLVSRMTQTIDPQPDQKVLEIGTGSGYQSSVLAELSNHVYTIEIVPQLAEKDNALYTKLLPNYPEYANIHRENADGYYGWEQYAPFDRIIVTTGIDHVPPDLLKQLAPGGIMVIPVGPPSGQTVLKITKTVEPDGSVTLSREDIYHGRKVIFVPFTAGHGAVHSQSYDQAHGQGVPDQSASSSTAAGQ